MSRDPSSLSIEEKRALLGQIAGARAQHEDRIPPTPGQERLWQLQSRDEQSPVYNIAIAYDLRGPLDVAVLESSLKELVRRHDGLRSTFQPSENGPLQVVSPGREIPLVCIKAAGDGEALGLEANLRRHASRPLDPIRGPLARFALFEVSERRWVLLIVAHHMIADRWSIGILAQELAVLYEGSFAQGTAPLPPPRLRYSDYGRWQANWMDGVLASRQIDFWREKLNPPPVPLELPTDRRPAGSPSSGGSRLEFALPLPLCAELTALANREGVTTYVALLAGFFGLLHRYSGQADLVICLPVAGRHRSQSRGIVGYFNNILPLRVRLDGDPSLLGLIRQVGHGMREVLDNQDLPFQRIAEIPALSLVPLARCAFALQNVGGLHLKLPGIESSYRDVPTGAVDFDLAFFMEEKDQQLFGFIDYRTDLFSEPRVDELRAGFQEVLETLVSDPDHSVRPLAGARQMLGPRAAATACSGAEGRATAPSTGASPSADRMARNELERRLILIWEDQMGIRPIARDSNFFELGGHSLLAARIFARMEELIGRPLPLSLLLRAPTIADLSELLSREGWSPHWSTLVPIKPEGRNVPLFLVHAGAGGILAYRRLAKLLGEDQPVWGLQAPRSLGSENERSLVEDIAEAYLQAMLSQRPAGPYLLGGHSFGALVALEIAQKLLRRGELVPLVVILDHAGPDAPPPRWLDRLRWHWTCYCQLDGRDRFRYVRDGLSWSLQANKSLPSFIRKIAAGGVGKGQQKATWRLKTLQATLSAIEEYKVQPYPGRLILFRGTRSYARLHSDPQGGWGRIAVGTIEVHDVGGTHMDLLEEPHVTQLAGRLKSAIERALLVTIDPREQLGTPR